MRFLTEEWLDAMNAAASGVEVPADVAVVVGQEVSGTPHGDVAYCFAVDDGALRLTWGSTEGADITVLQDYDTAVALARGELPAQQAVAEGRLKLRGDMGALVRNGPVLAAISDVFRSVRERTDW